MNRCDCHIHVIDLSEKYPLASSRDYTPHEANADAYKTLAAHLELDRAVVIQPSIYGYDNSCTRDAIQASNGRWRGIAVLKQATKFSEVRALHEAGFRGIRFNLLHSDNDDLESLESLAELIAPFDWHIEFAIEPKQLFEIRRRLAKLPIPFVIDHMARLTPDLTSDNSSLRHVLHLLQSGKTWIKLSGPYIISKAGKPYNDLAALAKTLINERPDRLVWGSNWPHPRRSLSDDDNVDLLNLLERWEASALIRDAILITNPAKLYDF